MLWNLSLLLTFTSHEAGRVGADFELASCRKRLEPAPKRVQGAPSERAQFLRPLCMHWNHRMHSWKSRHMVEKRLVVARRPRQHRTPALLPPKRMVGTQKLQGRAPFQVLPIYLEPKEQTRALERRLHQARQFWLLQQQGMKLLLSQPLQDGRLQSQIPVPFPLVVSAQAALFP